MYDTAGSNPWPGGRPRQSPERECSHMTLSLLIGRLVTYEGRVYRFSGITPVSVQPTRALLEDLRTGAFIEVPASQVTAAVETGDDH
jgi:hypothetical protein